MATSIVGCGKEFAFGEVIYTSTPGHSSGEVVFEAQHNIVSHCGMITYTLLVTKETRAEIGKNLFRALCKDCAVKDGISW
jgi:hypothetical protein